MAKVTNKELSEELSYIRGKLEAEERFAKEHRDWEVRELQKIEKYLTEQNGRIRSNEKSISWLQGIAGIFTVAVGWMFKKIFY